ncbi:MAG: protein translocase subunit SecD [Actinomycetota bacterium]|nr:protein translocase subunit SecD [Actinomycetota bacterium]
MRRYPLILVGLVVAMAAVVVLALFRQPTLGLDLQGGLEIVLEAQPPKGEEVTKDGIDRSIEIMRERIDKLGVTEPEIRSQGANQILIEMPGVHDAAQAAEVVGRTASLQFYDLEDDVTGPSRGASNTVRANTSPVPLLTAENKLKKGEEPNGWYLISKDRKVLAGPAERKRDLLDELGSDKLPAGAKYYAVPHGTIVLTCARNAVVCPGVQETPPSRTYYYLFEYQPGNKADPVPEMTGRDLRLRGTQQDFDPQTNEPIVLLEFTGEGGDKFHEITRELARRGRSQAALLRVDDRAAFQHFAIVLDNEIRSWPTIDFNENPDGIAGGRAQITGLDSVDEAKNLALVLQTGALPYTFVQLEQTNISATLGEDSLREAMLAGIAGLLAVAVFLLLFYRFLGLVAVLGLAIYGVFLYGAILVFNVTMTLPGIAGLILTIGVAADANVVIFERIKEEVRAGKSVRAAIAGGYRKGFSTIVDANVVTAITAFVLFLVATGGVRGFALMLLVGTLISMITAVLATRALLGVLAGFRWFDNPALMGAKAQKIPAWQRLDFMRRRYLWFAISATILAVGIGSLALRGLNLGIDFRGGSQVTFKTETPASVEQVRREAAAVGLADAVIQGRGDATGGRYTSFSLRTEALGRAKQGALQSALERDVAATSVGFKNVSASFSEQILRGALLAIAVSLALIVLYVSFRYQVTFALPVLVALLHDILITLGVYSLTGREMTTATVAAVLTILGYSIYDTIIIFDRVRENMQLMRRSSFAAIANQSLWETIRRSLATTFITLLPVTSLLLFGGATLKDFAFALLVGIGSGAYSTIFIATPLLTILKERDPEYAKRRDVGLVEKLEVTEAPEAAPEPAPEAARVPEPQAPLSTGDGAATAARREARRKRRRARPHGRAR